MGAGDPLNLSSTVRRGKDEWGKKKMKSDSSPGRDLSPLTESKGEGGRRKEDPGRFFSVMKKNLTSVMS